MQGKDTSKRDRADQALAGVVRLFESGELPGAVARSTIARLESDAPSQQWSLANRLLCLLNGTDDARGYRQWQAAGRQVKKGARSFAILAPRTRKITETKAGEEVERVAIIGFLGVPVFRYEDTDGEPIERPDYTPTELPPLFDVATKLGVDVKWLPFADRFYGFYRPGRGEIVLASPDAAVYFHELAHAAHDVVLKRAGKSLRGGQDRRQEVVAETVAAVLGRLYDHDLGELATSRRYIENYATGKDAARAVVSVLADVQAVLDVLLEPVAAPVAVAA